MSPAERRIAELEIEVRRRQIARLDRYVRSGACAPAALMLAGTQRRELLAEIADLTASLPQPFAAAVTTPAAAPRLRRAHGELQSVRSDLRADSIRAQHRAQGILETARRRELAELNRIPMDELLELAPSTAAELQAERGWS